MKELKRTTDLFSYADKRVKVCLRKMLRRMRQQQNRFIAGYDELNELSGIRQAATDLYYDFNVYMQDCLRDIAKYYYKAANDDDLLWDMWLSGLLQEPLPTTGYIFREELSRKRDRFYEEIIAAASTGKKAEKSAKIKKATEKALNYASRQIRQVADNVAMEALTKGYNDNKEVEKLEYVTQRDGKVCEECRANDYKIYKKGEQPYLPLHYNCRCFYIPVKNKKNVDNT